MKFNVETFGLKQALTAILLATVAFVIIGCRVSASNEEFFGKTTPPAQNILRYVNGGEPESLDPAISSGQPEARIYMALYEGLVEYDPKSLDAIPAIAERWEINNDSSEFVFHLRRNARWSTRSDHVSADFVLQPPAVALARSCLAHGKPRLLHQACEGYNSGSVFVRDPGTRPVSFRERPLPRNRRRKFNSQSKTPLSR